jgi:hypothetical protein
MMHSLFNHTFLAARGNKEWFDILVPLAIAAIYMIFSFLRKKSETQQQGGGAAEKPRSRPLDQSMRQKQLRQNSYNAQSNPAAIRQAAQREFDEAKELARRQFNTRMERIREYEENKPMGVPDAVWEKQIDGARKTVQNEYEEAQQQAREEYQRIISRLPAAPSPPARKTPKPQPQKQPVAAYATPQPPAEPPHPTSAAPKPVAHQAKTADMLAFHLGFTKDDLTRGILYSEILGKPLALREDA